MRLALLRVTLALMFACVLSACGKKGPPLPPIVRIPAAVDQIEARRRGNEVVVTLTVPSKNIDGTVPVDIERIEVYGYTGTSAPPRGRFLDVATLVGTIEVPKQDPDDPQGSETTPTTMVPGVPVPGGLASLRESLTPDTLIAKPIPPPAAPPGRKPAAAPPPVSSTVEVGPLRRFYLALPYGPRGRFGPPGMIGDLRLTLLPEPPSNVTATHAADSVMLEWEPSGGVIGFVLERTLTPELSPLDAPQPNQPMTSGALEAPAGSTRYNVYREMARSTPDVATDAPPAGQTPPLNTEPLDALTFADPVTALDGLERCYVVRALRGEGPQAVEGDPSTPVCVTPVDDAAPQAPTGLETVSDGGAITLTWVPNAEPDVAGYVVLRGEPGDATLTPVTDTVVTEPRFTDRTVRPGVRYVYAVQAFDTRLPKPNMSAPSARVEESAR